jgi:YLP motif-containing protein 1
MQQLQAVPSQPQLPPAPLPPPAEFKPQKIDAASVFLGAGRRSRPSKMCILLRGLPGTGKTHVAKLLRDTESDAGGAAPRILCLDDYFMVEATKEEVGVLDVCLY